MIKKLILYSWNVLNPTIHINAMSWKNYTERKNQLASIDNVRFSIYRKIAIMNIINEWLRSKYVVICLQEVCEELLLEIKDIENIDVFYTKMKDNDCRVTIVKGFDNPTFERIHIEFDNKRKDGLLVTIDNYEIYNLHLHWKWTSDISKVGKIIETHIKSDKYIICGDMNKSIKDIQPFIDEFDCLYFSDIKGYTGINTITSKRGIIDHIFTSSAIENKSNIHIISKVLKYKIMYKFSKILKMINNITAETWISNRKDRDISDHKPIRLIIKIE